MSFQFRTLTSSWPMIFSCSMLNSLEHFFLVEAQLKIHLETCFPSLRLSILPYVCYLLGGCSEGGAEFYPALGGKRPSNERFLYFRGSYIPTPIHAFFSLNALPWLGVDQQTGNFKTLTLQRWTCVKFTKCRCIHLANPLTSASSVV